MPTLGYAPATVAMARVARHPDAPEPATAGRIKSTLKRGFYRKPEAQRQHQADLAADLEMFRDARR